MDNFDKLIRQSTEYKSTRDYKFKNDSNIWKRHILDTDSKKSWLLHLIN